MALPTTFAWQKILECLDESPSTEVKISDYEQKMGFSYTPKVKLSCLKSFSQRGYIEYTPKKDSFCTTTKGDEAWDNYVKHAKPDEYF